MDEYGVRVNIAESEMKSVSQSRNMMRWRLIESVADGP
jgi:hypothetical protein